jgi:hypothetical protein
MTSPKDIQTFVRPSLSAPGRNTPGAPAACGRVDTTDESPSQTPDGADGIDAASSRFIRTSELRNRFTAQTQVRLHQDAHHAH